MKTADPPVVSVIVPVYNDPDDISTCIESLLNQTYPDNHYEIIVVDNGSTDNTPDIIDNFPVIHGTEYEIQGSYAARNAGIELASGDIYAFTDADCRPVPDWLEAGVENLQRNNVYLVGGDVVFSFGSEPTGAQLYDSITNMQIEANIAERSVCKTANLFARASVFEEVGLFDETLRSGGDVEWTARATKAGHTIAFEPAAKVFHPARTLRELFKKHYRTGIGKSNTEAAAANQARYILRSLRWGILPPHPLRLRDRLRDRSQTSVGLVMFFRVHLAAWLCNIATNSGRINGMYKNNKYND